MRHSRLLEQHRVADAGTWGKRAVANKFTYQTFPTVEAKNHKIFLHHFPIVKKKLFRYINLPIEHLKLAIF